MNYSSKDHLIDQMVNDPEYDIRKDGTIWTNRPKSGPKAKNKIYPWRRTDRDNDKGYKIVTYKGTYFKAHRVIYRKFKGKLDSYKEINHLNSVRSDNRPENLELIEGTDNIQHMVDSGNSLKGENCPSAVLTDDQVRQIRSLLSLGWSQADIGKLFGVCRTRISDIKRGRTYQSVK